MCHFKGLLKIKLLLITLASLYCNVTVPEIYVGKVLQVTSKPQYFYSLKLIPYICGI